MKNTMKNTFNYENVEVKTDMGKTVVRKVCVKNGKGYKSVTKYYKGKKIGTVKKPIHMNHIYHITNGNFVPRLFSDCKCREKKTRKNK